MTPPTQAEARRRTEMERLAAMADAHDEVIAASLNFCVTQWGNGRETADASMDLDHASDRLDDALNAYVTAATTPPTPEPKETT
jgi:hypothetical protein